MVLLEGGLGSSPSWSLHGAAQVPCNGASPGASGARDQATLQCLEAPSLGSRPQGTLVTRVSPTRAGVDTRRLGSWGPVRKLVAVEGGGEGVRGVKRLEA